MKGTNQPVPLRLGDIVRVLESPNNDEGFENHIAVVTEVNLEDVSYPYQMHVVSGHPYQSEIWFTRYERIGNVNECVELLKQGSRRGAESQRSVRYQTAMR